MPKPPLMSDPAKEFVKLLSSLDRSRRTYEKFRDLLELGYCAFAKLTAPTEERADQLEAQYMSIVNRYEDKDAIRAYPDLLGIAWNAVKDGGVDFLGKVSGELEVLDSDKGQFFTPYEVSKMMAAMTLGDMGDVVAHEGYVTIGEPAAGAGGMVLAAADVLAEQGYTPGIHMLVHAVDVSQMAYHMCFLQLTWRGIPAYVERANSLSLEHFEGAWTPPVFGFVQHHGHLSFNKPDVIELPMQLRLLDLA